MKHLLIATALIISIPGATLAQGAATSTATSKSEDNRAALAANQMVAEADARTAALKADLHLTPDQDKNWSGFASSLHDLDKARADRQAAFQTERGQQNESGDVIDYLKRHATALDERSADMKKLADAAQPLYASLDEQQKRRFANELMRLSREGDTDR